MSGVARPRMLNAQRKPNGKWSNLFVICADDHLVGWRNYFRLGNRCIHFYQSQSHHFVQEVLINRYDVRRKRNILRIADWVPNNWPNLIIYRSYPTFSETRLWKSYNFFVVSPVPFHQRKSRMKISFFHINVQPLSVFGNDFFISRALFFALKRVHSLSRLSFGSPGSDRSLKSEKKKSVMTSLMRACRDNYPANAV